MTNAETLRATLGIANNLVITKAPAGAAAVVGGTLVAAGVLATAGIYECLFRVDGLKSLDVRLTATFASGSSTTSGGSMRADQATALTAWTGVGAMATTVEQALTLAALKGEQYAKVIITTVGAVVQFTNAEVFGLAQS